MKIRAINRGDYDRLLLIWEAAVRATHDFVQEEDLRMYGAMIAKHELWQHMQVVCAVNEADVAVGFAGVAGDALEVLFVHPDYMGKGVGRLLLLHSVQAGAVRVDVNEQNERARGFYRVMGFEEVGRSEVDAMGKPYPIVHMAMKGV